MTVDPSVRRFKRPVAGRLIPWRRAVVRGFESKEIFRLSLGFFSVDLRQYSVAGDYRYENVTKK